MTFHINKKSIHIKPTYMKHIIIAIFIALLGMQPVVAQTDSLYTDSSSTLNFDQTIDSCFKVLNYSSVTTGLLLDKAIPTVSVGLFDGTINDSNEANMFKWRRAYGTLRRAFIDSTEAFDSHGAVVQTMQGYLENGIVPIAILNYQYNAIKVNALEDSLLTIPVNGLQLQDVSGRAIFLHVKAANAQAVLKLIKE